MSPETVKLKEEKFPFHLTCAIAGVFGQSVSRSEKSSLCFGPSQSNRSEKSLKEIMILRKAVSKYSQIKLQIHQN